MSYHATLEFGVGVRATTEVATKVGLPKPRESPDEYGYYLNAADVKKWADWASDIEFNPRHLSLDEAWAFAIAQGLRGKASDYIYEAMCEAPGDMLGNGGWARKNFLRKKTKAFRIDFI